VGSSRSAFWKQPDHRARRAVRQLRRRPAWLCLFLWFVASGTVAQAPILPTSTTMLPTDQEPITPIPQPAAADLLKLALGERLFSGRRLSHDGTLARSSCHDLHTNGASDDKRTRARDGSKMPFIVLTVFNAALSFPLNWEGKFQPLESQTQSSLENPVNTATSVDEVLGRLDGDKKMVERFDKAYGHAPDRAGLLDAIATYERSLLTPESRFDRWLSGDPTAITAEEQSGYALFKSLGCVSCHQGVNVGGNLFERYGVFRQLGSLLPELSRVPSLRNVAVMAPYFHDGSSPALDDAVRKMAAAHLNRTLTDHQVAAIIAFLRTLTGSFGGTPVAAPSP
jgi:cytochrome c peroxidase